MIVHEDVAAAVDAVLRDKPLPTELRFRNEAGEVIIEQAQPEIRTIAERNLRDRNGGTERSGRTGRNGSGNGGRSGRAEGEGVRVDIGVETNGSKMKPVTAYAYGVARNRLYQAARRLHVPLTITDDAGQVDMIVTLKNYYRRRPKLIVDAERRGTPIFVLRANTVTQMENFLMDVFHKEGERGSDDPFGEAMKEAEKAIVLVRSGEEFVDLTPRPSSIRRRQHELAHRARLESESYGDEPQRRVRISRRLA
jgi:hypothetical protein